LASLPTQPLPQTEWRTNPCARARQGNLRADEIQERPAHSRSEPMHLLPQRSQVHQQTTIGRWHRQAHRPFTRAGRAAASERGLFRAVPARRFRALPRRNLDGLQPERHTRRDQRSDQRPTKRSHRVLENAMKLSILKSRICFATLALLLTTTPAVAQDMPLFRLENFTTANGLPDNHVFCVLVDGNRIWAGTENGLGLYENGAWKTFRPVADQKEQSLAHQAVLSLALDPRTGDLWAGTMGGLSRISAGRVDTFTQLNSGLSNDIVYGVGVQGDFVWTATAAGASRLNTRTGQWALFNERNTPM